MSEDCKDKVMIVVLIGGMMALAVGVFFGVLVAETGRVRRQFLKECSVSTSADICKRRWEEIYE